MRIQIFNPLSWTVPVSNPLASKFRLPQIKKRTLWSWIFWYLIGLFLLSLLPVFFRVVEPSLTGQNGLRIGADSSLYLWYAGMNSDPDLLANTYEVSGDFQGKLSVPQLFAFGANLIGPVLVAKTLQSNFLILLFNYLLFFISMHYLFKLGGVNRKLLLLLLLLNPVTVVSLLTVNKEIFALLSVALLSRYLAGRRSAALLVLIVIVSILARWESALLALGFIFLVRWQPANRHRGWALATVLLVLSLLYPFAHSSVAPAVLGAGENDMGGRIMTVLNAMQDHFLFFIAVWPKLFFEISGILFNFPHWFELDWSDLQNSLFTIWAGAAAVGVAIALFLRKRMRLSSDYFYYSVLLLVSISILQFVQFRYVYPAYIFCCVELAIPRPEAPGLLSRRRLRTMIAGGGAFARAAQAVD